MAKKTTSTGGKAPSSETTIDRIAKAAVSREMLAAGLTAAAAAIAASPTARRKIRDAGLDAADSATSAATSVMNNASKLGTLIAEAVAEAAQRVLSGKWTDEVTSSVSKTVKAVVPSVATEFGWCSRREIFAGNWEEGFGFHITCQRDEVGVDQGCSNCETSRRSGSQAGRDG